MRQNQIINHAVPKNLLIVMFVGFVASCIYYPAFEYLSHQFPVDSREWEMLQAMNAVASIITVLFYDFSLLFVYIRSLHIYGKWWYSKNKEESDKYGINQREHQILIRITRFSVVCTVVVMADVLMMSGNIWFYLSPKTVSFVAANVVSSFFYALSQLAHVSAIYFSYEFGYESYLKVYGKIHEWMYQTLEKAHRRKTHNNYVRYQEI